MKEQETLNFITKYMYTHLETCILLFGVWKSKFYYGYKWNWDFKSNHATDFPYPGLFDRFPFVTVLTSNQGQGSCLSISYHRDGHRGFFFLTLLLFSSSSFCIFIFCKMSDTSIMTGQIKNHFLKIDVQYPLLEVIGD